MKYRKHVREPWFSLIRDGKKTREGRLNGGDFRQMVEGDVIEFYNNDSGPLEAFEVEIIGKRMYDTVRQFLLSELSNALPGVDDVEQGIKVYRQFFTAEAESRYGVVSIEVRVLEP